MLNATQTKAESVRNVERSEVSAQIGRVFEEQRARRWEVAATTAGERIAKLGKLRAAILDRKDELREAMHRDFSKPAAEVDLTELQPVLFEIGHAIKHLPRWMKPVPVGAPPTLIGTQSRIRYEPKGNVLILAPWNYPFNLLMSPLVAAV